MPARSIGPPLRVLVIDDDTALQRLYRMLLEEAGHSVRVAANGDEALSALSWEPDLILLDLMLPVMDGYEFLMRLRSSPEGRRIPVMIVSAALPPTRERISGADAVLRKPFDLEQLVSMVAMLGRRSEVRTATERPH